jgi:hypothetical protein
MKSKTSTLFSGLETEDGLGAKIKKMFNLKSDILD